jgi:5'-nucleotidase
VRRLSPRRFAVDGTPTDCVLVAVNHIIPRRRPDLVLSGVNRGRNAGEDVIYSGTVAGAVEGTVIGIPSLALSQAIAGRTGRPPFWETSLRWGPEIIRRVIAEGIPRDVLINVNFPDCRPDEVKRIAVVTQGRHRADRLHIDERKDGRGNPYYWIAYRRYGPTPPENGTDIAALEEQCISVTPLRLDMTDEPYLTKLTAVFDKAS